MSERLPFHVWWYNHVTRHWHNYSWWLRTGKRTPWAGPISVGVINWTERSLDDDDDWNKTTLK